MEKFLVFAIHILQVPLLNAATISVDFGDIDTGVSGSVALRDLGIEQTYMGFRWGYGDYGGINNRTFTWSKEWDSEAGPGW